VKSDEALLQLVAQADRRAFRELYERHADRAYHFGLSIVRNPTLAEEVLQEAMLAVWNGANRFRGKSKVTTWILGIVRNLAHNLLRRESRADRTPQLDLVEPDPAPTIELREQVQRALGTLPEHQREVLHLVFYEEMSVRETADVLGIPEGTVKSRMYNARKSLAKELT